MSLLQFTRSRHRMAPGCTCLILTRDGARTIRAALDSALAARCFNEILVLYDTATTDNTGSILAAYQAAGAPIRIIPYTWSRPPDFATARNFGISQMRTAYGFWLDDDEVVNEAHHLRALLAGARGQAFSVWVVSPLSNGHNFNMYQPRLFPVRPGVKFECPVFERIDWSIRRQGIPIISTPYALIYHTGYQDDKQAAVKNVRNAAILRPAVRVYQGGPEQQAHIMQQYRQLVA